MMKKARLSGLLLFLIIIVISCSRDDETVVEVSRIRIEVTFGMASEEGIIGEFKLKLTDSLNTATQVKLEITGSAENGIDYETISSTAVIPANRLSTKIAVTAISDGLVEESEEVIITIIGTDNNAIVIDNPAHAKVAISDASEDFLLLPEDTRFYMVNPNATEETVALFYNLKILSKTKIIVGQQDAFNSFFNNDIGESDIKKTTGKDPGLLGSDFMFITDDKNDETPSNWFFQQENIIKQDAIEAYDKGMVNIFIWHLREPYNGNEFFTSNMTNFQKNNAMKSILLGGANHEYYKQKLEKVALVAKSMVGSDGKRIPIIFRPFHEFDGDWFWWGKPYCTAEEFKTIWRFTVEYLRDVLNVDNMLFAFSPDSRLISESNYLNRYPGDEYVDILGMDNYADFNDKDQVGLNEANDKLQIISSLSIEKVKIAALTESCYFVTPGKNSSISGFYSNDLYNVLTENDIELSFMMFWRNTQDTYCTPPPTEEAANDFIDFINKPDIMLSNDLPDIYTLF